MVGPYPSAGEMGLEGYGRIRQIMNSKLVPD